MNFNRVAPPPPPPPPYRADKNEKGGREMDMQWKSLFEGVCSELYLARFQRPFWARFDLNNSKEALGLFLKYYAYERQGRNPDYPHIAYDIVMSMDKPWENPKSVWKSFVSKLKGKGANERNNPLYHVGRDCNCIFCALKDEQGDIVNIINVSKTLLENGKIVEAEKRVHKIRGVGDKITAFFLRDVAVYFNIAMSQSERYRLQPIDIWVRRVVNNLCESQLKNDKQVARWIVENFDHPERANQGMWYFGAQIAGSEYALEQLMSDFDKATEACREHIKVFNDVASIKVS